MFWSFPEIVHPNSTQKVPRSFQVALKRINLNIERESSLKKDIEGGSRSRGLAHLAISLGWSVNATTDMPL